MAEKCKGELKMADDWREEVRRASQARGPRRPGHQMNETTDGAAGIEATKRFPTVGIGTSAGGVHALQTFFEI